MRLLDPKCQDLATALRAAVDLANVQVATERRITAVNNADAANGCELVALYAVQTPAGFFSADGSGPAGETVAAFSVAWYTRLNGVKVVQIQYGPAKVTRDGVVETPSLVSPGFIDQIAAAGGYPVLASERLAGMFAALLRAKKEQIDVPPEADAVYAAPGDLTAWKALADTLGSSDLLKAIGG
jgi:hypothetical protein